MGRLKPRSRAAARAIAMACAIVSQAAIAQAAIGQAAVSPIRAAYFYHYMGPAHLDSLRAHGFDRAVIHWIPDSLDARGQAELAAFAARGQALGLSIVPEWSWQSPARLASRPVDRRYTWGRAQREADVPCPLDSLYWRSALIDRAEEFLASAPAVKSLAIDLELFRGGRHHLDAGPCRCGSCLAEYGARSASPSLTGLMGWEEARLERMLAGLLSELAARHPGLELGVLDLDFDSFVHRALARALTRVGVVSVDYCERSYGGGAAALTVARERLDALGAKATPLLGGVWLKRHRPGDLTSAVRAIEGTANGYFVFTTFSLWLDPTRLSGPYTLLGTPQDYWSALAEANQAP